MFILDLKKKEIPLFNIMENPIKKIKSLFG